MNEQEMVAGFNEWMRLYMEDSDAYSTMEEEVARVVGGDGSYGQRAAETLRLCAERVSGAATITPPPPAVE